VKPRRRAAASSPNARAVAEQPNAEFETLRPSSVSKVSHTLSVPLAERLAEFAFFQRVSESAVIEYSLLEFFARSDDDATLGETLRRNGAGRRRKPSGGA